MLGVTRRCMAHAPQHIREMPAPGPHVAWIFCCAEAMGWPDPYLVEDLCCGAPTTGVIPDSGVLRAKHRPATAPMARCGHDDSTTRFMGSVEPKSPEAAEGAIPLWDRTMAEVGARRHPRSPIRPPGQGPPPVDNGTLHSMCALEWAATCFCAASPWSRTARSAPATTGPPLGTTTPPALRRRPRASRQTSQQGWHASSLVR